MDEGRPDPSGERRPWVMTRREVLRTAAVAAAAAPFSSLLTDSAVARPGKRSPAAEPVQLHWLDGPPVVQPGTAFGVPWPRGAVARDTSFVAAMAEGGDPVPIDSWPLAYWPDGSLKWTGHAVGAGAAAGDRLVLTPGASPDSRLPSGPLVTTTDTAEAIEIGTGVIRCRIAKSGYDLIPTIERDTGETLRAGHLVLFTEDGAFAEFFEGEETVTRRQYRGWVENAVVERSGPVRTVVRVNGTYRGGDRAWLPFTVRFYFHAGAESIRVVHYFIFDGDQHSDFIRGLGMRWSVPMRDPLHDRHVRFVAENDGIWGEAVRVLSGLRAPTPAAVRDAQSEGTASPPLSEWGGFNWAAQIEDVPVWNDYKLVQNSADSFHIAKRTDEHGTWLLHAGAGRRAHGLGWVGGPTGGGIAFGLRDFWEKFPAQLDIRAAGTDEATVTVWFWSPDVPAMDLRDYDDVRHGLTLMYQEAGRGLEDVVATPEGIARSHELMIWALPSTPRRERLLELAQALRSPPLLVADPEYYYAIQPFGVWSLPDRSTPARAALEDDIDRRIDFYRGQIEQRKWYGFWFHGDVMWGYDNTRHVWRYDSGGHAWHQGELGFDQSLWYQFLRTGRPEVFRM
ncbi:MAG TPA: hypothetical protein VNZ57_08605, partial [Longimicrobiales bacterium]|nr:hypothetical protein [Longimicrobiales bacterium]